MPWGWLGGTLGGGRTVVPSDDPLLGGVANANLALELVLVVLETCPAPALGQAELVDRLLALAAEQDRDLSEVIGELGRAKARVG